MAPGKGAANSTSVSDLETRLNSEVSMNWFPEAQLPVILHVPEPKRWRNRLRVAARPRRLVASSSFPEGHHLVNLSLTNLAPEKDSGISKNSSE